MSSGPFTNTNPFADAGGGTGNRVQFAGPRHASEDDGKDDASSKHETESKAESDHIAADRVHSSTSAVLDKIKTAAENKFHLHSIRATGPGRMFNPTTVHAHLKFKHDGDDSTPGLKDDVKLLWRSRDNRKGRNSTILPSQLTAKHYTFEDYKEKAKEIGGNIVKMFTTFPYWDMAFWSGFSYTIGSVLFTVDGALGWSIDAFPSSEKPGEDKWGVPFCFFIGALFYQVGAVMAYLEAVNDGSFHGSSMARLLEGHADDQKKMLDDKIHHFFGHFIPHPHQHRARKRAEERENSIDPEAGWKALNRKERPGSIYPADKRPASRRGGIDRGEIEEGETTTYYTWRWWPSWHMLRTHHVYEIGYIACAIQLFGVTLYGMTAIVVLPGILDTLAPWQELGAFWVPQMVAAACFLIASIMFTLETQEKWWKPELKVIGWWIGAWSTVGSVGFELCAAFGPTSDTQTWAAYQSELSSMWGSAAYLIGSLLQWYEAVNKNPVAEIFNESGPMKSYMVHPI